MTHWQGDVKYDCNNFPGAIALSCAPKMTPVVRIDFRQRKDRKLYEEEAVQWRKDDIDSAGGGFGRQDDCGIVP
jgi:hypothetical protein